MSGVDWQTRLGEMFQNVNGKVEIGRVALGIGLIAAVVSPIAFEAYEVGWNGGHFDVTAWCLAYPGGILALIGGGAFALGNKEKQVAQARLMIAQPPLDDKGPDKDNS